MSQTQLSYWPVQTLTSPIAVMSKHYKSAADISDLGKVQIARACGVAIVTNGNMYPTMELLLRRAIQCASMHSTCGFQYCSLG